SSPPSFPPPPPQLHAANEKPRTAATVNAANVEVRMALPSCKDTAPGAAREHRGLGDAARAASHVRSAPARTGRTTRYASGKVGDLRVLHSSSSSTFQYEASAGPRNGSHSRYVCRRAAPRNSGVHRGRTGFLRSFIPASSGVRPPLLRLQGTHEQTTFSQLVFPPWERGTTWSRFSSERAIWRPQYWQVSWSRA